MASITLYADEECTLIMGSGLVGAYKEIYGSSPIITTERKTITFDEQTVDVWHICNYYGTTLERIEATTIPLTHTDNNVYQYFYITPVFRIGYKYTGSLHNYTVGAMRFEYNQNGNWTLWGNVSDYLGGVYDVVGIQFRTGEVAKQNIYGTILQINSNNWLGIDLLLTTNQGATEVRRCSLAISKVDYFFDTANVKPYKPKQGNQTKRAGTGTGYYPNNPIPALPTESINAAFSSVLGRGNGLTYYRFDGDCLEKLTEFLYDTTLTLKFRNAEFRDAVASLIFIPYNVTADVINSLQTIYLANKPIYPNSSCNFITRPLREIDFGIISLTADNIGFKTFADYTQTTATLYLPCYGAVNLDMHSIANGILHLRAVIDVRNGNILYRLETQAQEDELPVLYGQYSGNCGIPVPVGGANAGVSILGAVSSIGTVATGIATGNPLSVVGGVSALANQTAPTIDKSGALQPAAAAYGTPVPVLQIMKKIMLAPPEWGEINGFLSAGRDSNTETQYTKLGDYSGFFRAADCDVSGISGATESEKQEIKALLQSGVYL